MRHTFVPGTCLIISLVLALSHFAPAQNKELTADESIPIPKVEFDAQGELKMTASPNSSPNDFDFLVGKWKMHNRHLDKRLANCRTWTEFDSSDVNTKILNGAADMDTYSTTQFPGMGGKLFEGLTLRLFDPKTRLWSLYWIASNTGKIDPPVVGSFDQNGVGHFFGKDTLNGKPILVVFRWDRGTKTAQSGVRPFHQITARRGNGISLTSRNGPRNDELRKVSDLTLQRFNELGGDSPRLKLICCPSAAEAIEAATNFTFRSAFRPHAF